MRLQHSVLLLLLLQSLQQSSFGFTPIAAQLRSSLFTTSTTTTTGTTDARRELTVRQEAARQRGRGRGGKDDPVVLAVPSASPLEMWTVIHLEALYNRSTLIKCPFFSRRVSDVLDGLNMIARFLVIRHKSLDLPIGCRVTNQSQPKTKGLALEEILEHIRNDWKKKSKKGYYITGRLTSSIYRDDCLFDGPDPDMPVRGLRKYLNAASKLFDHASSHAELLSLRVVDNDDNDNTAATILATWQIDGVLRLPWRPKLPQWTGSTYYRLDKDNLVYRHEETWDMSVAEAFLKTLVPELGEKIWGSSGGGSGEVEVGTDC